MSTSMASTDGGVIVPSEGTAGAGIGGERCVLYQSTLLFVVHL